MHFSLSGNGEARCFLRKYAITRRIFNLAIFYTGYQRTYIMIQFPQNFSEWTWQTQPAGFLSDSTKENQERWRKSIKFSHPISEQQFSFLQLHKELDLLQWCILICCLFMVPSMQFYHPNSRVLIHHYQLFFANSEILHLIQLKTE